MLSCQLRGDSLRLSVWDTGVGIDETELQLVFQEFQRLDYAERLDDKGLGLGLAICDRIARMLDHVMDVRSRPGRGSRFSITVPLASQESIERQARPSAATGDQARLEDLKVLCIDNEPDILEGMNMLLDRWGCEVMLAENLEQARKQIAESMVPDMVLVDHHLADNRFGLDVMKELDGQLGITLPAIVITADRSPELEDEVKKRGYGLLRKPIKPAALRALMTNTLKNL